MRPGKAFSIFSAGWLLAVTLLANQAGAAEKLIVTPNRVANKLVASDAAMRAVVAADGCEEILSPRLSELEGRLFAQIHDGRFGHFSLLEAGLIAGGVDSRDELRRYSARFDALVESLRGSGKVRGTPRQRAQAVFTFLHETILRGGYSLQASDLRQALDSGRFNCVTASLLFNCLADRFQLKTVALEIPGHAMSRLELSDQMLDIETTCPQWFARIDRCDTIASVRAANPAQTQPQAAVEAEAAEGSPVQPAPIGQQPVRQVSEVELVATIYYNRGVDLLAERRFADAAAANAKAVRLDPENATAKGNFLATINNWAIELGTAGEYEKAAALLRLGQSADSGYAAFRSNYVQLFRRWSEDLCRGGHYADALRLLTQAAEEQPGENFFREAAVEVLRRWQEK